MLRPATGRKLHDEDDLILGSFPQSTGRQLYTTTADVRLADVLCTKYRFRKIINGVIHIVIWERQHEL
jgi:hypothetical protein